jgi:hypothetical protein
VITPGLTDSVLVIVGVRGNPASVRLEHSDGTVSLQQQPDTTWTRRVPAGVLIANYRTGDLRNTAASLEVLSSGDTELLPLTVNVRDNTVPDVSVSVLSAAAQAASHVVNIRYDSIYAGEQVPPEILHTLYQFFGDDYDFIAVLEQVSSPLGPLYFAVRNAVTGLGLQTFTRTETFGSAARLQGILHFPYEATFDPAATSFLHQLAHRWMNYSNLTSLRVLRPHWPISTLAYGITGTENPVSGEAEIFRWQLTANPNGSYAVRATAAPLTFNDFELYLMGLLPADSVGGHVTFLNQNQRSQLRDGGTLSGATDTITVADWVARDGARAPAWPAAQDTFRMATVVLSRGGLLSREELAFYNNLAQRGEAEVQVTTMNFTTRLPTLPFAPATGGRGKLITRLRPDPL